jgi:recombinational DNA repair protein RecR
VAQYLKSGAGKLASDFLYKKTTPDSGADLEYADEITLSEALTNRKEL